MRANVTGAILASIVVLVSVQFLTSAQAHSVRLDKLDNQQDEWMDDYNKLHLKAFYELKTKGKDDVVIKEFYRSGTYEEALQDFCILVKENFETLHEGTENETKWGRIPDSDVSVHLQRWGILGAAATLNISKVTTETEIFRYFDFTHYIN